MDDLENLLLLDGEVFLLDNGYWVKFEAKRVEPSREIPHGLRYSLTLHDRTNGRVIGYDNAHSFRPRHARYGARKETWDHLHKRMEVFPYEFESAVQLLEDFWQSVEMYMKHH